MPEKIKRDGCARPDVSLCFAGCLWDKPQATLVHDRVIVRLSGAGYFCVLNFDHQQFDDLFDAMCEAVKDRDMAEIDKKTH
jgi:hypothetical protein